MCRAKLNRSRVYKAQLKINMVGLPRAASSIQPVVKAPIFYDTMNVLVDQIMTNATFSVLQSIIEMYGFEKYQSIELDRSFAPVKLDLGLTDILAGLINTDKVVEQYLDLKYIAKNICRVRADGYLGIDASDADCNCFDFPQSEIDKICDGISKELLTLRFNKLQYKFTADEVQP